MTTIRPTLAWVVLGLIAVLLAVRPAGAVFVPDQINEWAVVTMAIWVQATPFLILGVGVAAVVTVVGLGRRVDMFASHRAVVEVPAAAGAGVVFPTCECAAVPTAKSFASTGLRPSAAIAFMVASPGANLVVIVSTLVAYTGREEMALARFLASILTAVIVGLVWEKLGRGVGGVLDPDSDPVVVDDDSGSSVGRSVPRTLVAIGSFMGREFISASALLALGAAVAGAFKTLVPSEWVDSVGSNPVAGVAAMVALALILSLCSESDAFVAASMTSFSPMAQLAFMTVGPVVDVKLALLQGGTFGRAFLIRFIPIAVSAAVVSSVVVALIVWGG